MQEAKQLFTKLKIYSFLDLALLVPISYSDTTLSTRLDIGTVVTAEAKVIDTNITSGKLKVTFLLTASARKLFSTFFRVTPYHHKLFAVGTSHIIQGKLTEYRGYLQMPQPRSIKEVGKIIPRYKTPLKEREISSLMECYINEQNLFNEGLDSKEVSTLIHLHFPKSMNDIYNDKDMKPDIVDVLKFIEAYNHIKKLRGKRANFPAIRGLNGDITEFIASLPFMLTKEQSEVIAQIKIDISKEDIASKRMVVGDVGSGKTMVMLASMMLAYPHKSILMAPTSLLALQLFDEATKFLPSYIKIVLVMQGKKQKDYGEADFIIGTHALLFKEDLPQASLVMVDEQHRFGTKQRQTLETLMSSEGKKPHFIQFSATPIPRTQAMMDSELLDVSLITTTPFERDVTSLTITRDDFSNLLTHIKAEIAQNHQVLIIYPLVEQSSAIPYQSLEESSEFWKKRFENVYVTHGKDKQKEEVLVEFREKGDLLLATTVVEVGISLPRLTLIVIVGAERLGLATLHQLRGRVGRNGLKSWCYLYSNDSNIFRLERFTNTLNGFDIAKLDLKFRDSGDILDGKKQSGQKFRWLDMADDESVIKRAKNRVRSVGKR
ncbi:MAG: ATP-dependent DNA helicase RecG [Sulfurovum sp.]